MRLLIINPNRSATVTGRIRASADSVRRPGDSFVTVGAAFGPELIVTPADDAEAVLAVQQRVLEYGAEMDGVILASFGNTGLEPVRERLRCPVVGIAQAAYCAAAALARRFAMVTTSPRLIPGLEHSVAASGLQASLAGILALEDEPELDPASIQDVRFDSLLALCERAAALPGVGCIVTGGGPLAGVATRLRRQIDLPVVDGTQAAIHLLRSGVEGRGSGDATDC